MHCGTDFEFFMLGAAEGFADQVLIMNGVTAIAAS